MSFLVFVVYSKHLHIFMAPLNVAFSRQPTRLGALDKTPEIDIETMDEDTIFGAGRIEHFTWKQLLDLVTCTECGRCQSQCPAWNTGKPLSPKLVIMDLRDELFRNPRHGDPRARGHRRRRAVGLHDVRSVRRAVPGRHRARRRHHRHAPLRGADRVPLPLRGWPHAAQRREPGRPMGPRRRKTARVDRGPRLRGPGRRRARSPTTSSTSSGSGAPGALDERARKTTQSIARLLRQAGVSFAVLGPAESCTGDPVRRLGNEYLFQMQAQQNIETLTCAGVKKVIASCPHCFNSLSKEYPSLGGNFEVVHHSQLLGQLVAEGRLRPSRLDAKVTYHDPCYLGRHSKIYGPPRSIIESVPGVHVRRDGPLPRARLLLRCRRRPYVARGAIRASASTSSAPTRPSRRAPTSSRRRARTA